MKKLIILGALLVAYVIYGSQNGDPMIKAFLGVFTPQKQGENGSRLLGGHLAEKQQGGSIPPSSTEPELEKQSGHGDDFLKVF